MDVAFLGMCLLVCLRMRVFGHNPPHSYCTYVVPCNGFRRLYYLGIALLYSVLVCFAMFVNELF